MQDSFAACPAATIPGAVYGRRRDDFRTAHPHAMLWPDFLTGQPDKPVRVLLIDDDVHIRKVISQELLKDLRTSLIAEGGSLRGGLGGFAAGRFAEGDGARDGEHDEGGNRTLFGWWFHAGAFFIHPAARVKSPACGRSPAFPRHFPARGQEGREKRCSAAPVFSWPR